jgi:hypothetical protein
MPKLRAPVTGDNVRSYREWLATLESCSGKPIIKQSVLVGISKRRFADIQQTLSVQKSRREIFWRNAEEEKEMKSCVLSAHRITDSDKQEI